MFTARTSAVMVILPIHRHDCECVVFCNSFAILLLISRSFHQNLRWRSIRYPAAHLGRFFAPQGSTSHRADSIDNQTGTSKALDSLRHNIGEDSVGSSF